MPVYGVSRVGNRLGAIRLGYVQPIILVEIDGTDQSSTVKPESLSIDEYADGTPNRATFECMTFQPGGAEVRIGYGNSLLNADLIFAGHILTVTPAFEGPLVTHYDVTCIAYDWLLNRRLVSKRWLNTSATTIALQAIAGWTSGFSTAGVEAGLEVVPEFSVTMATPREVLDRLAERIGGRWALDYAKVLHFGVNIQPFASAIHDIDDSDVNDAQQQGFRVSTDWSQVRTRVLFEGGGALVPTEVAANDTIVPVSDAIWYDSTGGEVIVGTQRLTYTGKQDGGTGALVGVLATPTTAPTVALAAGSGVTDGSHYYAVTFYDGTGETTPGPNSASVTTGQISAPGSNPTPTRTGNGNLSSGAYQWKWTYTDSAGGETTPGPATPSVTMDDVSAPGSVPTVISGGSHLGGIGVGTYKYVVTYTTADGETTPSSERTEVSSDPDRKWLVQIPTSSDSRVTGRKLYRTVAGGSTLKLTKTISNNSDTSVWDDTGDGSLGASAPGSNTARSRRATVEITVGPSGTAGRKLYRTTAGGSSFNLVATIANNTATTYDDNVADGSLGAAAPSSNTTAIRQVNLTSIPTGPTGTTGRKVYRTAAGASTLKLLTTIANNTSTTYTDSTADGSLGATAPSTNTSALTTPNGTVNAGTTTIPVTGVSSFSASGGWAYTSGQYVRYTGVGSASLTGVPASGAGAILATLNYGSEILAQPALTGVPQFGTGAVLEAIETSTECNVLATAEDSTAQTSMAAAVGSGDGIHEALFSDNRLSLSEAEDRAAAKLAELKDPIVTVTYRTYDQTTHAGRDVTISRSSEGISGTYRVQRVRISDFSGSPTQPIRPLREVEASSRRFTFESLLRQTRGR